MLLTFINSSTRAALHSGATLFFHNLNTAALQTPVRGELSFTPPPQATCHALTRTTSSTEALSSSASCIVRSTKSMHLRKRSALSSSNLPNARG